VLGDVALQGEHADDRLHLLLRALVLVLAAAT
jgi:hypothetical protein